MNITLEDIPKSQRTLQEIRGRIRALGAVNVGAVDHPMVDVHYIEWIVLETATSYQKHDLKPGEAPEAHFAVTEPVVAAYEYCNLHGLWVAKA